MKNEKIMEILLKELKKCKKEVPVSSLLLKNDEIYTKSHNNRQKTHNVLGHTEINTILKAEKKLKDWRLDGYNLYVTLKPCEMCQSIIKECRIDNVYYLIDNKNVKSNIKNMHKIDSIYYKQIYTLFNDFFAKKREKDTDIMV